MRRFIPLLLAFAAIGCSKNSSELSRFHEDGRAKPVVAVASLIDTTSIDLPWSLSEELTTMIVDKVAQTGSIFVSAKDDLSSTDTPFGNDLSWIRREFPEDQFVVFLELVEHETIALSQEKNKNMSVNAFETAMNLKMAVKMRVVDLRSYTPKIVLQEMVRDTYYIPKNVVPVDYKVTGWGTEGFISSPMGLAHSQLVLQISSRISDYIQLAKSR